MASFTCPPANSDASKRVLDYVVTRAKLQSRLIVRLRAGQVTSGFEHRRKVVLTLEISRIFVHVVLRQRFLRIMRGSRTEPGRFFGKTCSQRCAISSLERFPAFTRLGG